MPRISPLTRPPSSATLSRGRGLRSRICVGHASRFARSQTLHVKCPRHSALPSLIFAAVIKGMASRPRTSPSVIHGDMRSRGPLQDSIASGLHHRRLSRVICAGDRSAGKQPWLRLRGPSALQYRKILFFQPDFLGTPSPDSRRLEKAPAASHPLPRERARVSRWFGCGREAALRCKVVISCFWQVFQGPPHPPAGRSPSVGGGPALRVTLSPKGARAGFSSGLVRAARPRGAYECLRKDRRLRKASCLITD